jgi:hypothetical protein
VDGGLLLVFARSDAESDYNNNDKNSNREKAHFIFPVFKISGFY